jgi:hypothetical protein
MESSKKSKVIQNPLSYYNPLGVKVDGLLWGDRPSATDLDSMKRAAARVFGPQKFKQELTESKEELRAAMARLAALEATNAKREINGKSSKEARLKKIIRNAKSAHPGETALRTAQRVDLALQATGWKLSKVCPKRWAKLGLPDQLADIIGFPQKYPKLNSLAKPYISKA